VQNGKERRITNKAKFYLLGDLEESTPFEFCLACLAVQLVGVVCAFSSAPTENVSQVANLIPKW
jgi:hypothetical protein